MPGGKLPDTYISTREAAAMLACRPVSIETGLRNRTFPIGWAWHSGEEEEVETRSGTRKPRRGQWNYRIPRQALMKAIETGQIGVNT